jgi:phage-related protein
MRGFGGGSVVEVIEDYETDTYRCVYTVRFAEVVYVLHVFQKKSKRGSETTQQDKKLIEARLREAESMHRQREE